MARRLVAAPAADGLRARQHGLVAFLPVRGGDDSLVCLQPAALAGPEHADPRTPADACVGGACRCRGRLVVGRAAVPGGLSFFSTGTESGIHLRQSQFFRRVRGLHASICRLAAGACPAALAGRIAGGFVGPGDRLHPDDRHSQRSGRDVAATAAALSPGRLAVPGPIAMPWLGCCSAGHRRRIAAGHGGRTRADSQRQYEHPAGAAWRECAGARFRPDPVDLDPRSLAGHSHDHVEGHCPDDPGAAADRCRSRRLGKRHPAVPG